MNKDEIFCMTNTEDLPKEVKKELRAIEGSKKIITKLIIQLFLIKSPLSVDEILIGLYRVHKIVKTRSWLSSSLFHLKSHGVIENAPEKRGVYKLVSKEE